MAAAVAAVLVAAPADGAAAAGAPAASAGLLAGGERLSGQWRGRLAERELWLGWRLLCRANAQGARS